MKKIEIMAPVSNRVMLEAAIHNGADSVYIGMPGFNARGRADELEMGDLEELIATAHLYDVKVYIAFNVLVFDDELDDALGLFLRVNRLGPDAWIVQDAGLASLMKSIAPDVILHASTQMTIVNQNDISFYNDLNLKRFTLARELSISEIEGIKKNTNAELEVFIHGSLCIAYSGQCFTSSGFGGRSANRGECAQSCRHEYDLYSDGKKIHTEGNYLVSPRDLIGEAHAADLARMGIAALKIEGRLKSPEYVAAAVERYRGLVDAALSKNNRHEVSTIPPTRLTFNRDAGSGWLDGVSHRDLVDARINSHTGLYLGKVHDTKPGRHIVVKLDRQTPVEIHKGDGIAVNDNHETRGSRVYEVKTYRQNNTLMTELSLANDFPYYKMKPGFAVYLTSSHIVQRQLEKSFTDRQRRKHIPVDIILTGKIGQTLELVFRDFSPETGEVLHEVRVTGDSPVEKSQKHPAGLELVKNELTALSASAYQVKNLQLNIDPDGFYPNRAIKDLRQRATKQLDHERTLVRNPTPLDASIHEKDNDDRLVKQALQKTSDSIEMIRQKQAKAVNASPGEKTQERPRLHVLARNPSQVDAILELLDTITNTPIHTIYLDFVYGFEFAGAVKKIKAAGIRAAIATARIYKPGELKQLQAMIAHNPDTLLVRNAGALDHLLKTPEADSIELVGDFSLNVTNRAGAAYFLAKGLHRITASHDLVDDQGRRQDVSRALGFLAESPAELVEVNVSYHLPSFYMEYCLFTKYLGNGKDAPGCGFPCKEHTLQLKDRKGELHPVIADRNCRNTMFNGTRKNLQGRLDENLGEFLNRGVRNFRVELGPDNSQLADDLGTIAQLLKKF